MTSLHYGQLHGRLNLDYLSSRFNKLVIDGNQIYGDGILLAELVKDKEGRLFWERVGGLEGDKLFQTLEVYGMGTVA